MSHTVSCASPTLHGTWYDALEPAFTCWSSVPLGHSVHSAAATVVNSRPVLNCLQSAHGSACRFTQEELLAIDLEGRCVITDHEAFILFNLYGPAITSEENAADRFAYKLRLYEVRGSLTSLMKLDRVSHMASFYC